MNNSLKNMSTRVKVFAVITFLTAVSSILMIVFGIKMNDAKTELIRTSRIDSKIMDHAKKIGISRGKITAQRKIIGGGDVELNPTEIAKACGRNNAILDKTVPLPDADKEDYLEKGYRVSLNAISKIDLARLYADLESNIPGSKIKGHNMSVSHNNANQWSVAFQIVKSIPKNAE